MMWLAFVEPATERLRMRDNAGERRDVTTLLPASHRNVFGISFHARVKNVVPITSFSSLSFSARVEEVRTRQDFKPCVTWTRPIIFRQQERPRQTLFARAAVRRDTTFLF